MTQKKIVSRITSEIKYKIYTLLSSAAVNIVSLSSAVGVVVLAAMMMLAPSAASFLAIAKPIPRLDPVIRTVLPFSLLRTKQKNVVSELCAF